MENKYLKTNVTLDRVPSEFYEKGKPLVKELLDPTEFSECEASDAVLVILNQMWFMHEYLNLGKARNIDYEQIKSFAQNNKDVVSYLWKKMFEPYSLEVLDSWVKPPWPIQEVSMYDGHGSRRHYRFH